VKSVLIALSLLCAAASACSATETPRDLVSGREFTLDSAVYGGPRKVCVRLPLGYDEDDRSFPVLYVVDGGFAQDFPPLAGMAALAGLTGQFRRFILVGVQTDNRYHELTVRSTVEEDLELNPDCGGAADFRRFLREEVLPWTRANFRTNGEAAVIGESLAGLFILETFLREPDLFTHYLAVSPSLWWRDMALSREAGDLLQAPGFAADRSLYMTLASEGGTMKDGVDRVVQALTDHAPAGLRWWYDPMPDEAHHTVYNPAVLRALRWVFAPPAEQH
jgi:predicted alpha/beta superfamily hydrolase